MGSCGSLRATEHASVMKISAVDAELRSKDL